MYIKFDFIPLDEKPEHPNERLYLADLDLGYKYYRVSEVFEHTPTDIVVGEWVEMVVSEIYIHTRRNGIPSDFTTDTLFRTSSSPTSYVNEWVVRSTSEMDSLPLDLIVLPELRPDVAEALDTITAMVMEFAAENGISDQRAERAMDYRSGAYLAIVDYIEEQMKAAQRFSAGRMTIEQMRNRVYDLQNQLDDDLRVLSLYDKVVPPPIREFLTQIRISYSSDGRGINDISLADSVTGTSGDDFIIGGRGDTVYYDGKGDDIIFAGDGHSVIHQGPGDNFFVGGTGFTQLDFSNRPGRVRVDSDAGTVNDENVFYRMAVIGGPKNDRIIGIETGSWLEGGDGNDLLVGQDSRDHLIGNAGNDRINAGGGDDVIEGGDGNDKLRGGSGFDLITGGDGNDVIIGGDKNDTIYGGAGNDFIKGDQGEDRIYGGPGNDRLTGGANRDQFYFEADGGVDRITDFEPNFDSIRLPRHQFDQDDISFKTLKNGDIVIKAPGLTIVLDDSADLHPSMGWFHFYIDPTAA
ncbi:calcium-binding protein [Acuticoccus kandeliae]|uniref:calcium-binding protein n=1 Tax=Acuticoccus kandeliae TaxID=2073160 RepID=UPI00130027D8|nr:calcium-binding protein [Acuticoccus kandeliae]